jgi:hypothetical protein
MKHLLMLATVCLLSFQAQSAPLPPQISDDFLKVVTVDLVTQMYPQTFYKIDLLNALRETAGSYEMASAFMYLGMADLSCTVAAVYADSNTCPDISNCTIEGAALNLPSCDIRSPRSIKMSLDRLKAGKKPFVLRKQCDATRTRCQMKWTKK